MRQVFEIFGWHRLQAAAGTLWNARRDNCGCNVPFFRTNSILYQPIAELSCWACCSPQRCCQELFSIHAIVRTEIAIMEQQQSQLLSQPLSHLQPPSLTTRSTKEHQLELQPSDARIVARVCAASLLVVILSSEIVEINYFAKQTEDYNSNDDGGDDNSNKDDLKPTRPNGLMMLYCLYAFFVLSLRMGWVKNKKHQEWWCIEPKPYDDSNAPNKGMRNCLACQYNTIISCLVLYVIIIVWQIVHWLVVWLLLPQDEGNYYDNGQDYSSWWVETLATFFFITTLIFAPLCVVMILVELVRFRKNRANGNDQSPPQPQQQLQPPTPRQQEMQSNQLYNERLKFSFILMFVHYIIYLLDLYKRYESANDEKDDSATQSSIGNVIYCISFIVAFAAMKHIYDSMPLTYLPESETDLSRPLTTMFTTPAMVVLEAPPAPPPRADTSH